ncbi:hypothetical protein AVEN_109768-1 [Araneus ventricosus]|uniref:Uncharacterized protein n=1 Tax=Araneus ventricosus TaxID=182803 RepID=A0A4Y2P007_ARAVE|nr:hypothetical protein AVEN_109768-1 [Araneus ventricosus]
MMHSINQTESEENPEVTVVETTYELLDEELEKKQTGKRKGEELETGLTNNLKIDFEEELEMDFEMNAEVEYNNDEDPLGLNDFYASLKEVDIPLMRSDNIIF